MFKTHLFFAIFLILFLNTAFSQTTVTTTPTSTRPIVPSRQYAREYVIKSTKDQLDRVIRRAIVLVQNQLITNPDYQKQWGQLVIKPTQQTAFLIARPILNSGMTGDEVRLLQMNLRNWGAKINISGRYDDQTAQEVAKAKKWLAGKSVGLKGRALKEALANSKSKEDIWDGYAYEAEIEYLFYSKR